MFLPWPDQRLSRQPLSRQAHATVAAVTYELILMDARTIAIISDHAVDGDVEVGDSISVDDEGWLVDCIEVDVDGGSPRLICVRPPRD